MYMYAKPKKRAHSARFELLTCATADVLPLVFQSLQYDKQFCTRSSDHARTSVSSTALPALRAASCCCACNDCAKLCDNVV
jgi:hypothetical protein